MKTLNTIFICVLIIGVFVQCRKDPRIPFCEEFPDQCVEITTIKDHFYFDVGTYWVYEEENSGMIDSQWVSKSFTNENEGWFNYTVESSISEYYQRFWTVILSDLYISGLVPKEETSAYVKRSKSKAGGFVGESYISIFFPMIGDSVGNFGGKLKIDTIHPKYTNVNNDYDEVLKISELKTITENKQPTIHYYAKDVGLIKKELIDSNQVWNLIRYNIIK